MSRIINVVPLPFRQALAEFLGVPTLVVFCFLLLASVAYFVEKSGVAWILPLRSLMQIHVFNDAKSTGDLLGTIASSTITVTSITISLILLAVQQSASGLTFQVIDQFLRRRLNQFTFGFFVGLALYCLIILSTVAPPFNPVIGASVALVLAGVALYLLLILLYFTIDQMRPSEIVDAIHSHALKARERQLPLIRRTRRRALSDGSGRHAVRSDSDGHVVEVDLERLNSAARSAGKGTEVVILVSVGTFVATGDTIAEVALPRAGSVDDLREAIRAAVHLAPKRDLDRDPAYGVQQLANIGWTAISTAKQNPQPGVLAVRNLRDLLARWSCKDDSSGTSRDGKVTTGEGSGGPVPVVYPDDLMEGLFQAFESLAVVSSESLQHQSLSEVLLALSSTLDRLSPEGQERVEGIVLRVLTTLGDHVLTRSLEIELEHSMEAFKRSGRDEVADAIGLALEEMRGQIGKLNSRSTRVPT